MDLFFIFCAKYLFVLVFLIAGIFFLTQSREIQIKIIVFGLLCAAASYILAILAGYLYYNPRPFVVGHFKPLIEHDTENGFPSDHVLMVSVAASVTSFFDKKVAGALWFLTAIVAVSRLYVGVHHAIDVISSALIAIGITTLFYLIFKQQLIKPLPNHGIVQKILSYKSFGK